MMKWDRDAARLRSELPVFVQDLTVTLGRREVLGGLTLTVSRGTVVAVTGRNGSGKSTFLRALAGLVPSPLGTVQIFGSSPSSARRRIVHLPQGQSAPVVFPARVRDIVALGCFPALGLFRRPGAAEKLAVASAIAAMGLTGLASRPIQELSAGEYQRTLVARALVQQADLLLLDEPFDAVDAESRAIIREELRALAAAGTTVLVVDHDPSALATYCDRVVRVTDGRAEEAS